MTPKEILWLSACAVSAVYLVVYYIWFAVKRRTARDAIQFNLSPEPAETAYAYNTASAVKRRADSSVSFSAGNVSAALAASIGGRPSQQDCASIFPVAIDNLQAVCAVLCDGMGGLNGGEHASSITCGILGRALSDIVSADAAFPAIQRAMHSANDAVSSLLDEQGNPLGCGTTALAAVVTGDHLFWCSTGDSRIYLHRDRTLYQLTTDQTYMLKLMEAVNAGNMTLQEAESHPKRNALISYVGSGEHLVIDCPPSAEPLRSGDTVLLATDGLYRTLSDGDIRTMLEDGSNAENTAITLVESAIARGGNRQDNTTVAIIRIN